MAIPTSSMARYKSVGRLMLPIIVMAFLAQAPSHADPATFTRDEPRGVDNAVAARLLAATHTTSIVVAGSLEPSLDHLAFGRVVARLDTFNLVPAWRNLLQRASQQDALCQSSCGSIAWHRLIRDLRRISPSAQLDLVQQRLNRLPYRDDMANWRLIDYWATPDEFLTKGGDCEDYAIAKYFALRAAGWPVDAVRLMLSHRRGEILGHAYLIVRRGTDWLVLDNRQMAPFRPSGDGERLWAGYSLNESSLWIHRNVSAPDFVMSSMQ